jgi:hypothetical protein
MSNAPINFVMNVIVTLPFNSAITPKLRSELAKNFGYDHQGYQCSSDYDLNSRTLHLAMLGSCVMYGNSLRWKSDIVKRVLFLMWKDILPCYLSNHPHELIAENMREASTVPLRRQKRWVAIKMHRILVLCCLVV